MKVVVTSHGMTCHQGNGNENNGIDDTDDDDDESENNNMYTMRVKNGKMKSQNQLNKLILLCI